LKQKILMTLALGFIGIVSAAESPLPADFIGEWRTSLSRPSYSALYLGPQGVAFFAAVGDGKRSIGGKGGATYDPLLHMITITFPDDRKVFRFRYKPETKQLEDLSGHRRRRIGR
jgi:hypothetical protein